MFHMKLLYRNLILTIFLFISASCDSWLELIPPQGLIREEFWQTKEDVDAVIMGGYSTFAGMDGKLFQYGEIRADMVFVDYKADWNARQIAEGNINSDNWFCDWSPLYKIVNYCNEVIANVELVQRRDDTFTDFIRDGYLAEAYFLRGLAYFYLVRMYKDVPFVTEPTISDDSDVFPSKMDGNEILEQVRLDLLDIREKATKDAYVTLMEQKGRTTRAAIDALLTDISLWLFDYEAALKYANNILFPADLEPGQLPPYVRIDGEDWFQIFNPGNSLEGILELQFDNNLNQRNSLYGMTWRENNQYYPSEKAIDMLQYENEPLRGDKISIREYQEERYEIWKYTGADASGSNRSGSTQNSANWIVYRLTDVELMKCEALAMLGRSGEALDLLAEIKASRQVTLNRDQISTRNDLEDAILDERAVELCFEGKRYFDLLRMGTRDDYARKSKLVEVLVSSVPSTQKRILAIKLTNPDGWYLPIHERELERNKNLVQNPYYED